MAHQGTQLSTVIGLASEQVDYISLDWPWLQSSESPGFYVVHKEAARGLYSCATSIMDT